jgi:hypothetical protein
MDECGKINAVLFTTEVLGGTATVKELEKIVAYFTAMSLYHEARTNCVPYRTISRSLVHQKAVTKPQLTASPDRQTDRPTVQLAVMFTVYITTSNRLH